MKVTLMNAISVDGFIAKSDGDSDWVVDDELFNKAIAEFGCILIGHTTFTQYEGVLYPVEGAVTFVYSSDASLQCTSTDNLKFVHGSPKEVLGQVTKAGFEQVLLGGGGKTNAAFAKAGLIDEMILDIHPLVLGKGVRLFDNSNNPLNLELSEHKQYSGFMQLHYKVNRAS